MYTAYLGNTNAYDKNLNCEPENSSNASKEYENSSQMDIKNYGGIPYSVSINAKSTELEPIDAKFETGFIGFCGLTSETVSFCNVTATGDLTISYTPSSEEYKLKSQEVCLSSDKAMLTISYDIENNTAIILGYTDAATLSKMSLFPNFWTWYFSNIYMAPLTLISAVFSAVSMMTSSRKNE